MVSWDGPRVVCEVTLRPDSPFVEGGQVPCVVALEYMSQCIGAFLGLEARREGRSVEIGFVLGTRGLRLGVDHIPAGEPLRVEAVHLRDGGASRDVEGERDLVTFDCRVSSGDEEIAAARLDVTRIPPEESSS